LLPIFLLDGPASDVFLVDLDAPAKIGHDAVVLQ
jgi:hypothetical protein